MASLDVLDYQLGLDGALASAGLETAYRRQAIKEARRVIDAMAFRFALMEERPLPEDLDYLRALEAVKPPERAAPILAARRPIYARVRRRRLTTTWLTLGIIALSIAALAYYGTSEKADEIAAVDYNAAQEITYGAMKNFTVTPNMTRLHVDGTILLSKATKGIIEVRVIDPNGTSQVSQSYAPNGDIYLRENVYSPAPGTWTLLVDFEGAQGSARVTVDGIRPAR